MSDRDASACGLCGHPAYDHDSGRGGDREYGGVSHRGCPACGATLSPVVTVKNGMVHHDGRPVTAGLGRGQDPSAGSFVRPKDGGFQAGHYSVGDGRTLVNGMGKSPKAAAEDAARKDATLLGRQFVKRPAKVESAIKKTMKDYGYE